MARSGADKKARLMAGLIEKWVKNPFSRIILGFITKRGEGWRRAEKALKEYAGMEVETSLGDRLACLLFKFTVKGILGKMELDEEEVREHIRIGYWRKGLDIGS